MTLFDQIVLLLTGLGALYLIYYFYSRYKKDSKLHDLYYILGFAVLFVSGVLLIFLGWDILESPWVLTVSSLIPLGISLGVANQFYPKWKKYFAWYALIGLLAIAGTSFFGPEYKKFSVPLFHGVAGLIIFLGPIFVTKNKKAPSGFWWAGVGGMLIGIGGIALAFVTMGTQLLFFSPEFILQILAPLLLLMTLAFGMGFMKDLQK
jgi:hypothetical protein